MNPSDFQRGPGTFIEGENPVKVPSGFLADEADRLFGERFGVDWEYES